MLSKLSLIATLGFSVLAQATVMPQIIVYTTDYYPILRVEKWEDNISKSLSLNPNQVEQEAQNLFKQPQWQQQEQQLKLAYEGVLNGWQNGIKKVPAILFQASGYEDSVIYGEQNVAVALTIWQRYYGQQSQ